MKKEKNSQQQESNILKFDSIKICKNGSYMIVINKKTVMFIHPNLLAAVKANSKKRAA